MEQSSYWDRFMRGRLSRRKVLKGGAMAGAGLIAGTALGCESSQPKPAATTTTTAAPTTSAAVTTPTRAASPTPAPKKPTGKIVQLGGALDTPKGEYPDPHRVQHALVTWQLWTDDLVMPDEKGPTDQGLATSWSISPDGLSWTFKLRKGVLFHDETEMTAEDVKFSFERQLKFDKNPGTAVWASFFDHAEVVDPYTVKAVCKRPEMAFLVYTQALGRILPKKYIEKVGDDYFLDHPVGTGPWKFVKATPGESIEFEAFEKHYARVPKVKTLEKLNIPDAGTRLSMLQAGQADLVPGLTIDMMEQVKAIPGVQVITKPQDYVIEGRFAYSQKGEKNAWHDERVRKAFMYAFNREKVAKEFYRGTASPSSIHLLPFSFGWSSDVKPWPYDPAKAKQLLTEAGYPNGLDFELYVSTVPTEGEAVLSVFDPALFRGKVVIGETTSWIARIQQRQVNEKTPGIWWRTSPGGYPWAGDAGYVAWIFDHSKAMWTYPVGDPKIDQMIEEQSTIADVEKRKKALNDYHLYKHEKQYFMGGFFMSFIAAAGPKVKSWNPLGTHHLTVYNVELKS